MSSSRPPASSRVLYLVPRPKTLSLEEAWEEHTARSRPSMRSRLASIWKLQLVGVVPELATLSVSRVTARQLTLWEAAHIGAGYAPKTTYDAWTQLAAAVRASLADDEDVPWRLPRGKAWHPRRPPTVQNPPPACCTVADAELLIHAAVDDDRARRAGLHGDRYACRLWDLGPRIAVALFLGLRNGELAGLGWDNLALEVPRPMVRVCHQAVDQWRQLYPSWTRPSALPKGDKVRRMLLHPTAIVAFHHQRELLEERGWYREDGPVFPSPEKTAFSGTWRNNANAIKPERMKLLAKAAGLPFADEWVTHSLRHSLATLESASGLDLRAIQTRTGHGSLRVLEGYISARTGRDFAPSAIPQLAIDFETRAHDTEPAPPPEGEE